MQPLNAFWGKYGSLTCWVVFGLAAIIAAQLSMNALVDTDRAFLEAERATTEPIPRKAAMLPDTSTRKTYRNEQYGFEVHYPDSWIVPSETFTPGTVETEGVVFSAGKPCFTVDSGCSGDVGGSYPLQLTVKVFDRAKYQPKGEPIHDYAIPEKLRFPSKESILVAGLPATRYTYRNSAVEAATDVTSYVEIAKSDRMYVLEFYYSVAGQGPEAEFSVEFVKSNEETLQEILSSFKFVESPRGQILENETKKFLDGEAVWGSVQAQLYDIHGLWGGVNAFVSGSGAFLELVTTEASQPPFRLSSKRYHLRLTDVELQSLISSFIENNFLTISVSNRAGVPDETRPTIVLVNARGQVHKVAKWEGDKNERFEKVYKSLLALSEKKNRFQSVTESLWIKDNVTPKGFYVFKE